MADFGDATNGDVTNDGAWRQTRRIDLAAGWLQLVLTAWWAGPTFWYWQHLGDPIVVPDGGPTAVGAAPQLGRALMLTVIVLIMAGGSLAVMFADTLGRRWCLVAEAPVVVSGLLQIVGGTWDATTMGLGVAAETPGWVRVLLSGWPNVVGGTAILVLVSLALRRTAHHRALAAAVSH